MLLLVALAAQAQPDLQAASSTPAQVRKPPPGFEPLPGAESRAEQADANALVIGAYAAFLALVFGYVIHVALGQKAISREMMELARKLERSERS